jgi:hypothetical protein
MRTSSTPASANSSRRWAVSGQREIEKAVRAALADGRLKGNEKFSATATIAIDAIKFSHQVDGDIELE